MIWCPYGKHEINVWWNYGLHIDIRVGLFIVSTDHKNFV